MQNSDHPLDNDRVTFTAGEAATTAGEAATTMGEAATTAGEAATTTGYHSDGDEGSTEVPSGPEDPGAARRPRARFRDRSRGQLSPSISGNKRPVGTVVTADTVAARDRRRRGLLAAALAVILLLFALSRLVGGSGSTASAPPPPTTAPPPTTIPFIVANRPPITATAVLGVDAKLKGPREAVELPGGRIAVADTDNSRVAILDNKGKLVTSITTAAAAFQQPFALATRGHNLYVLDAMRGAIEQFDASGHFIRELVHNVALLQDGRGLAVNQRGQLYVVNPRSNAIVVFSPDGKVVKQMTTPLGNGPTQYNQPSDIAVARDDSLYIYDNINTRIKKAKASGSFITQMQAPPSDTFHSVHVLPLPDGRLVASDPGGSLLVYPATEGAPIRLPLRVAGQPLGPVSPLGLSLLSNGNILVTDDADNRLLVVPSPQ